MSAVLHAYLLFMHCELSGIITVGHMETISAECKCAPHFHTRRKWKCSIIQEEEKNAEFFKSLLFHIWRIGFLSVAADVGRITAAHTHTKEKRGGIWM